MGNLWTWIKGHLQWIAGGAIALIVAWYLLLRPQSTASTAAPTSVSFPPSTGGGSGSSTGGTTTTSPLAGNLPYTPDFGILQSIGDAALRTLYENEYNLQVQINNATAAGNQPLVSSLTGALQAVQGQIAGYVPYVPPVVVPPVIPPVVLPTPIIPPVVIPPLPTLGPPILPTPIIPPIVPPPVVIPPTPIIPPIVPPPLFIPTWLPSFTPLFIALGSDFNTRVSWLTQTLGINNAQGQDLAQRIHLNGSLGLNLPMQTLVNQTMQGIALPVAVDPSTGGGTNFVPKVSPYISAANAKGR